jgi:hypothetical protein
MWLTRASGLFVLLIHIGLSACSTTPVGERSRIIDIPLAAAQSDLEFSIVSRPRFNQSCTGNSTCPQELGSEESKGFDQTVVEIAGPLQEAAMRLYPDLTWCSRKTVGGCFDVYVVEGQVPGSSSSSNGRITLNSCLARWQAYETVLAFVVAREMGHVIARHHQEQSSVNIVASVLLNVLVPGSGVLKSVISTGVARLASESNQDTQVAEADAIAYKLLKESGLRMGDVARSLLGAPTLGDENYWAKEFSRSSSKLVSEASAEDYALASFSNEIPVDQGELSVSLAGKPSSNALVQRAVDIGRPAL